MLLTAVGLFLGSTVPAATPVPPGPAIAAAAERKVCRRYMQQGTMIRTRTVKVCRTPSEWVRNEQDYQAMARSYQHAICGGQSNCQ